MGFHKNPALNVDIGTKTDNVVSHTYKIHYFNIVLLILNETEQCPSPLLLGPHRNQSIYYVCITPSPFTATLTYWSSDSRLMCWAGQNQTVKKNQYDLKHLRPLIVRPIKLLQPYTDIANENLIEYHSQKAKKSQYVYKYILQIISLNNLNEIQVAML